MLNCRRCNIELIFENKVNRENLCFDCKKIYDHEYYEAHCENVKQRIQTYARTHQDVIDDWRERNRETISIKRKARHVKWKDDENAKHRLWMQKNRADQLARHVEYQWRKRLEVIRHYSPEMKCTAIDCEVPNGARRLDVLEIDHVFGGGTAHKKITKGQLVVWIIKNGFPEGFQILCASCHRAKSNKQAKERSDKTIEALRLGMYQPKSKLASRAQTC